MNSHASTNAEHFEHIVLGEGEGMGMGMRACTHSCAVTAARYSTYVAEGVDDGVNGPSGHANGLDQCCKVHEVPAKPSATKCSLA
jgi:hypothetical protein